MLILGSGRCVEIWWILGWVQFKEGFRLISMCRADIWHVIHQGIIWSLSFGMISIGILLILAWIQGWDVFTWIMVTLPQSDVDKVIFFLVAGLIGPIAEELFFRGILYNFFRPYGMVAAMLFSTFLFSMAHVQTTPIPVFQLIGGCLFAIAYEKEKYLLVPMILHVSGNMGLFVISLIYPLLESCY